MARVCLGGVNLVQIYHRMMMIDPWPGLHSLNSWQLPYKSKDSSMVGMNVAIFFSCKDF